MRTSSADSLAHWCGVAKRAGRITRTEVIELARQVRAWQDHPAGPDGCPELIRRRGIRARNRIVSGNLLLVPALARKYMGRLAGYGALDMLDLLQAGALGLSRAAEKFDPEKGYEFSTYAYNWIRQAIGNEVETRRDAIKIPVAVNYALMDGRVRKGVSDRMLEAGRAAQSVRSLDRHLSIDADGEASATVDFIADTTLSGLDRLMEDERLERIESVGGDDLALLALRVEDGATIWQLAQLLGTSRADVKPAITAAAHRLRKVVAAA
ncbi:sigma-70 family RNA polymerase sigma factor [Synechococcus sp. Cruz-9H2]|uniref:sigma-70 family RNA polymerase sigma factor n=1 Tax=unclassified Synechococcus TaxID=2626047 RepID=UPI0020CDAC38|nr:MULTISPECIES: sigma-70 family RNA polymerase sigma factor [unclassified Synechococcus]MCP9821015.1 sigma-70 family RNA polymerase sigma factor [Synechococcus sp. Cruz-9H2]MCP9845244.1 sigma-70 family RNA polymerase sigma factor [Synechococcus sp. Edmonson 11F2]MCP9857415.1 sigma-70 family RNA polymerase sigma factor [Synechococcus sp. Cruz-9C9]MCP9864666.1 sigma-70 family RNA polymerase sigma factor [Synechococcus sp. Cruz-7E5]MCP9871935.1 sigma-70 family RNA polymerase sigma factor [Synech